MESFTLPTDAPMDGIKLPPVAADRPPTAAHICPIDLVGTMESLAYADEFACRAVEAIGRRPLAEAGGDFERSFRFYVHAAIQTAASAIAAHGRGDEVRAASLSSQAVLLFRQLPGRAKMAAGLLRSALADPDGLDPAGPLRFIAEGALRRAEARTVLGDDSHGRVAAELRAAFTERPTRFEARAVHVLPPARDVAPAADRVPVGLDPRGATAAPGPPPPVPPSVLSAREREVVRLIAEGLTNREIGCRLGVKGITVNTFVSRIFSKLGVDNRAAAAVYAVRNGLCDGR
jgi:DNA-binding CsgD family transcriptional regulator